MLNVSSPCWSRRAAAGCSGQKCEGLQPRNTDGEVSSMFFYPELFKCEDAGQIGGHLSVELLLKVPWNDFDYSRICFCFE